MTKLSEIEGISEVYGKKLEDAEVNSIEALLKKGSEKKGRKNLAEKTGISEKFILKWVNRADLARIKGVSTQYADLLEYAGVDTIPELAQRNHEHLQVRMAEVNEEKHLARRVPSVSEVKDWVAQAKKLPRIVNY
jgi:predicted flap endonuclease-1-like 5' DNA nuclease